MLRDRECRFRGHKPDAAVLFTDIVGSSRLVETLGDRPWLGVVLAHNRVVRGIVRAYGGRIVKSQGDGFMIVFADTTAAFGSAVAIQRALADGRAGESLEVRCGIHYGPVLRDGRDFFGRTVIVASRLTNCANGGEIIASAQAVGAAQLPEKVIEGHESRPLRGLSGTFETHRVNWNQTSLPRPTSGRRRLPAMLRQIALSLR